MNIEEVRKMLPTEPRIGHVENVTDIDMESVNMINVHYCLFKRATKILNETPYTEVFGFGAEKVRSGYAAECYCTACEDVFYTGYKAKSRSKANSSRGIVLIEGEDGCLYEGVCSATDTNAVTYENGDIIICPRCGETLMVREATTMNEDECHALRTQQVSVIGKYAALITFEMRHEISSEGTEIDYIQPISALVINDNKQLELFIHYEGEWKYDCMFDEESYCFDGLQEIYEDFNSINDCKIGGIVDNVLPDLTGTTGEKTGLPEFIAYHGANPAVYLVQWSTFPNIENLIKSAYGENLVLFFNEIIQRNINYEYFPTSYIEDFDWIDFEETKPHKMLGVSKEDFFCLSADYMSIDNIRQFYDLAETTKISVPEYISLLKTFNAFNLVKLGNVVKGKKMKALTFNRALNYLRKQRQYTQRGLELFIDYIQKGEVETEELIFPKNLEEAHDRMIAQNKLKETQKLLNDFLNVKHTYAEIEYSDGELCAIIPTAPSELETEGKILCHCVGRYMQEHSQGQRIIIFIRHSRRPERSYYTLNIDFSGSTPQRIQLHGYGNERHGANKQYSHSIPKKVTSFVEKYEKEILTPWLIKKNKQKNIKKSA